MNGRLGTRKIRVPKRPIVFQYQNEKQILAVAHFFLQMQKASSKTRFVLNKIYLRITSSLQILIE